MVAMVQFTWILVFLVVSGVNSEAPQNGDVDISNHPYMASIIRNGKHLCSGAIIDEYHVITSDRCVPRFKHSWDIMHSTHVVTGTSTIKLDGERNFVRETFSQNHYINPSKNPVMSGVGVLKLLTPIKPEKAQPIELSSTKVPSGAKVQMVGWMFTDGNGKIYENLKEVTLREVNHEECQQFHEKNLTNYEFCTEPETPGEFCEGNPGSALIYEGKLVGLSTYGISCTNPPTPDVHTNAEKMNEYLQEVFTT